MRGFSTIEIMIALAVMATGMTGVLLITNGSGELLTGGEQNAEALGIAQDLLEHQQILARKDFNLVGPTTTRRDGYDAEITVEPAPIDPYAAKLITASVSWQDGHARAHSLSLTALVARFSDSAGVEECDPVVIGDWAHPALTSYPMTAGALLPPIIPFGHTFSTRNPAPALDAYRGTLYLGLASTSAKVNDDLFIFDASDLSRSPRYLASVDTNPSSTDGVNDVVAAGSYLYVASARDSNFKTCKPGPNCSQLRIFDVSNPNIPGTPINFLLPTSSPPFVLGNMTGSGQAVGTALFYRNGYLYLGLSKTASGPEFNIIDVHDPTHPQWIGGYRVGASINRMVERNGYAYLATSDKTREIITLDVHDPTTPTLAASFDPTGTSGYEVGKSIFARGDTIFAGMSFTAGSPELYILDATSPFSLTQSGAQRIDSTAADMIARGNLLFLITTTTHRLEVWNSADAAHLTLVASSTLPGAGSSLDCEGNTLLVGSSDGTNGYISIITPAP